MTSDQDSKVIIRYPNQSGALVEVIERTDTSYSEPRTYYGARCTACLDYYRDGGAYLDRPRDWASTHSATCRALAQPEPINQ